MNESKKPEFRRRRFPRVKAPVLYCPIKVLDPRRRIHDISLGGVRIYSDEQLREDDQLEMELLLPNGQTIIATARIAWINKLPPHEDARFDVGLEFINLPANATREIKYVLDYESPEE
ncbi:MAG: PilZ domain-containing protein [Candidatus Aminicenantes bacterium]|nr:MAG: PilZ domain-containing protein [Candidatus Aminicenantes bacterium]